MLTLGNGWKLKPEEQSCCTRNKITVGADCISRQIRTNKANKKGQNTTCPLCNAEDINPRIGKNQENAKNSSPHCYIGCEHTQDQLKALCASLYDTKGKKTNPLEQTITINEGTAKQGVRRSTRNKGVNRDADSKEHKLAAILDPSKWNKKSNILINKWCQNINRLVHHAILTKHQPALAKISGEATNFIHGDERPLNDNVVGKIFDITFNGGSSAGTWRVRAEDYDPLSGNFIVNTTGLDLGDLNMISNRYPVGWFTWTDVDLNGWLEDRNLVYIPPEDTVIFEESKLHDIYKHRNVFQDEVGGRDIEIR